MTASRSPAYHRSVRRVSSWCAWYIRDLSGPVADGRRDEIASDLYEHGAFADENGVSAGAVSRSIMARWVRGIPADLAWRHQEIRQLAPRTGFARVSGLLPALAYTMALLLLGRGGYVLARVAGSAGRGEWFYDAGLAASVVLGVVVCALGLVLLTREKTRVMGAVWIAVSVYGLLRYGSKALVYSSATFAHYFFIMPNWNLINLGLITGLVTFFLAMALWWWPTPASAIIHAPRRCFQKVSPRA